MSKHYNKFSFKEIESKEQAIKIINHMGKIFILLGALQIILIAVANDYPNESRIVIISNAAVYIVLGFLLRRFKSPVIAITLLVFAVAGVALSISNLFDKSEQKSLPIIGIVVALTCVQAIRATLKLKNID